jgi:hypothetical protein
MGDVSLLFLLFDPFLFNNDHFLILLPSHVSRLSVAYNKGNARHS